MKVTLVVNGQERSAEVEPRMLLVHFLRDRLGLTGTHIGCDTTSCGACTVLLDGTPVKSCTMFAVQAEGRAVTTVEGLAANGKLHPIQEGFKEEHGLQCGFCTPGMLLASKALLEENPDPSQEEIRWALSGNLCRCTGYQNIVNAVQWTARKLQSECQTSANSGLSSLTGARPASSTPPEPTRRSTSWTTGGCSAIASPSLSRTGTPRSRCSPGWPRHT